MDKSLFRYIWRHSRRDQLVIGAVVLASLPFYFLSLDLPRRIVNEAIQGKGFREGEATTRFLGIAFDWPAFLGGGRVDLFEGFSVDRMGLLFGLSGLFLGFVVINGAFKYWINVQKGALGERMLRRMRFELFSNVLRFTPETLRRVKASETATIIKDEVEPIGGFIGDAYILPAFQGAQALTALAFIMVQNVWLGLLALAVVGVQFLVIPKLRRELIVLGRERQLASRRLAGRIGEVVDGREAVDVHNGSAWERAEIGHRLFELFDIRFRIYRRKFMVKFLNNFLAQLTPFLFYAVGGYFALKGQLDIGQLVAVIGAYRELPPPLKELIDWDQMRLDVQVKYEQVVQHFAAERLLPLEEQAAEADDAPLSGPLVLEDVTLLDAHGAPVIDHASLEVPLPARVALLGEGQPAASALARIVARRQADFSGRVRVGERDLGALSRMTLGRRVAYASAEPVLFPGTLRENLVYGLRHRPLGESEEPEAVKARRLAEALRTGNPRESIADPWIDYELAGAESAEDLDRILLDHLRRLGFGDDVYRFGLSGRVDPAAHPELAERIVEARRRLKEIFEADGMRGLVEGFDPERYNAQATVAENLLFGTPVSKTLKGRALVDDREFRDALERTGLSDDLVEMGAAVAETMTEIFRGVPPGHPLFEQFSFIGADELPEVEAVLRRRRRGSRRRDDATRLLALPLGYIEPRHRLGLLDEPMRERLVAARADVRRVLAEDGDAGVEFYDPERVSAAAPLRDNLLFGRVSHSAANAQGRVMEAITAVVDEMELRADVERLGLDHGVGPSGRLLTAAQRAGVDIIRCLVKRPSLFVVDGAQAPLGEGRASEVLALLREDFCDRALLVVVPHEREADGFDALVRFEEGRARLEPARGAAPDDASGLRESGQLPHKDQAGGVR